LLAKSTLTPPDYVFPIVWSLLYVLIALVGSFFWRYRDEPKVKAMWTLFITQLLLNWAWTIIFFGCQLIALGFWVIVILVFLNVNIALKARKKYYFAANMMIPYILWLVFAGYLNFMIWQLN
jgi:tryptophan-rich sensory protein